MKCALIILLWFLPWIACSAETADPGTDVDGIVIEPSNGEIEIGTVLTLTFPTSMVGTADLDVPGRPWPFNSQPELQGEFLWKSQTEGMFTVFAESTLDEVVRSMVKFKIHRVFVIDDATGELEGVITTLDVLEAHYA